MLVVCSIFIALNVGGVSFTTKEDVEGVVIKDSQYKYLVDFTKGISRFNIYGDVRSYKKKIVNKHDCVKE